MVMRQTANALVAVTMIAAMFWASVSEAAFVGPLRAIKFQRAQISFGGPVLAPMAHVRFCLRYQADCEVHGIDFRRRHIALTPKRWNELNKINREVNHDIAPVSSMDVTTEQWSISPPSGNCHDYAVTKRHELLARGWASRSLLLSEVVVPSGEHHLVLVVRTRDVDLVLDNLNADIRPVGMTRYQYQWVRIESPYNPKFWSSVTVPSLIRTAMISH
jgi:predicted transglutaminase-like cysteine proteinase